MSEKSTKACSHIWREPENASLSAPSIRVEYCTKCGYVRHLANRNLFTQTTFSTLNKMHAGVMKR